MQRYYGPDRDDELDAVVRKLVEIGTELRMSNKTKTRYAYTRAVYKFAVSKSEQDSLPEFRSKEICGRLLRSAHKKRADRAGFDNWYDRETHNVATR